MVLLKLWTIKATIVVPLSIRDLQHFQQANWTYLKKLSSEEVNTHFILLIFTCRWRLPKYVFYHAQLIAHQDCVYRNMDSFKYIALHDIDEILVPNQPRTIPQLISYLDKHFSSLIGCYVFSRRVCQAEKKGFQSDASYFSPNCGAMYSKYTIFNQQYLRSPLC